MGEAALITALGQHALRPMGGFAITAADGLGIDSGTLLLVGPDEPSFWTHFSESAEYRDGNPDPMDRWSARVLGDVATLFGVTALFPFGGPPHLPFYTWAIKSGRTWASTIGFLVHDEAGLFVSYRGALVLPWKMDAGAGTNPCETCIDQPCKSACPVGAFSVGYDVAGCKAYLATTQGQENCMAQGCAARRACPVGQGRRVAAQAAFHMGAFL
jgi:hypothetical protein